MTEETSATAQDTTAPDATTWSCQHAVDWTIVGTELKSLNNTLKRVVLRRREVSAER